MNFNENLRGQTNAIILFILLSGDRHTDELKEIIDNKFSEVKIGTLYSIVARMKTQGYITEYRASSSDGSRRKFYKITESGVNCYESEFAHLFNNVAPIENKKEVKLDEPQVEYNENNETEELYLKYVKKAETIDEFGDIDFSTIKIEEQTDNNQKIFTEEQPKYDATPLFIEDDVPNPPKLEVDYDSVVGSNYEYKSVLNKLFPKANEFINYSDYEEYKEQTSEQASQTIELENQIEEAITSKRTASFDSLYDVCERENIKIKTSFDTNRYQGTKILANKLKFHSSVLVLLLAIVEYFILNVILSASVNFDSKILGTILIIFGSFSVLMGLIYLLKHNHTVKDLPKFINSIEIAIILAISIIIISVCIASINSIDLYNFNDIFNSILLPSVLAINIPIYVTIVHFLSKLDFYQTV